MIANIYVDGFNLFNGVLRRSPHKWLDLSALVGNVIAGYSINKLKYYTARVRLSPNDPDKPARQAQYIRALRTIPNLSVHYGHFMTHPVMRPISSPPANVKPLRVVDTRTPPPVEVALPLAPFSVGSPLCFVPVTKTEEKGSDVNIATHLLWDAVNGEYEAAIIISNDSDLVEPIRIVKHELGKQIVIINPHKERPSVDLKKIADRFRDIRTTHLAASQFADTLKDARGEFCKPASW